MTSKTPMIEWSMSIIYAIWHASKVFHNKKFVRLCQMRYESHHTQGEPPVGATICSMCAASLAREYSHVLSILGHTEQFLGISDSATIDEHEMVMTVRDTLGWS